MRPKKKVPVAKGGMELVLCAGSRHVMAAPLTEGRLTAWMEHLWKTEVSPELDEESVEAGWEPMDEWVGAEMERLSRESLRLIRKPMKPSRWVTFEDAEGQRLHAALHEAGEVALLVFGLVDRYDASFIQVIAVSPDPSKTDADVAAALGLRLGDAALEHIRSEWTGLAVDIGPLTLADLADDEAPRGGVRKDGVIFNG